tara:strand:- start:229 stop:495 length:267 start_codon:yes stop_codon:yes gene_type:complete
MENTTTITCQGCETLFSLYTPIGLDLCPDCSKDFETFLDTLPLDDDYTMENDNEWTEDEYAQVEAEEYFETREHELDGPETFQNGEWA